MNRLFGKLPATTAAILVAASFAMVSYVDAVAAVAAVAAAVVVAAEAEAGAVAGAGVALVPAAAAAVAGGAGRWPATKRAGEQLARRCAHEQRSQHQRQQREQRQRRAQRQRQRQQRLLQQRLGQRLPSGGHCGCDRGDGGRYRLGGARPAARLRAGELRRRGLPTMRKHVVCPARVAVSPSSLHLIDRSGIARSYVGRAVWTIQFVTDEGRLDLAERTERGCGIAGSSRSRLVNRQATERGGTMNRRMMV